MRYFNNDPLFATIYVLLAVFFVCLASRIMFRAVKNEGATSSKAWSSSGLAAAMVALIFLFIPWCGHRANEKPVPIDIVAVVDLHVSELENRLSHPETVKAFAAVNGAIASSKEAREKYLALIDPKWGEPLMPRSFEKKDGEKLLTEYKALAESVRNLNRQLGSLHIGLDYMLDRSGYFSSSGGQNEWKLVEDRLARLKTYSDLIEKVANVLMPERAKQIRWDYRGFVRTKAYLDAIARY